MFEFDSPGNMICTHRYRGAPAQKSLIAIEVNEIVSQIDAEVQKTGSRFMYMEEEGRYYCCDSINIYL